jgi:hypothetical protein
MCMCVCENKVKCISVEFSNNTFHVSRLIFVLIVYLIVHSTGLLQVLIAVVIVSDS